MRGLGVEAEARALVDEELQYGDAPSAARDAARLLPPAAVESLRGAAGDVAAASADGDCSGARGCR